MKISQLEKNILLSLTIIASLAACGPVVTPNIIEVPSIVPAATQPWTPAHTETETWTQTPTKARPPTETPVPRPDYATRAHWLNDMTLVESLAPIVQDVLAHPTLTSEVSLDFEPFDPYSEGPGFGVYLNLQSGLNCNARAFVRMADPVAGRPDRWYVVWEIRNPGDDHSRALVTYLGDDVTGNDLEILAGRALEQINDRLSGNQRLMFTILTRDAYGFDNPVLTEMYTHVSPEGRAALNDLEKNHIISDALAQFPVWIKYIQ